ncbi:hypothetical protein HDU85_003410 [Gaertneriomyces sp. JEL0708]|nr:hypothetical protein HDU85_003410 [Gaertneriomyces sp. JEL0708]
MDRFAAMTPVPRIRATNAATVTAQTSRRPPRVPQHLLRTPYARIPIQQAPKHQMQPRIPQPPTLVKRTQHQNSSPTSHILSSSLDEFLFYPDASDFHTDGLANIFDPSGQVSADLPSIPSHREIPLSEPYQAIPSTMPPRFLLGSTNITDEARYQAHFVQQFYATLAQTPSPSPSISDVTREVYVDPALIFTNQNSAYGVPGSVVREPEPASSTFPTPSPSSSRRSSMNDSQDQPVNSPTDSADLKLIHIPASQSPVIQKSTLKSTPASQSARHDPYARKPVRKASQTKTNERRCEHPGCDFVASNLNEFKKHGKCHDARYNVPCRHPECPERFARAHDMNRHYRSSHTDDRPYECKACNHKFCRNDALKRHVAKANGPCLWAHEEYWADVIATACASDDSHRQEMAARLMDQRTQRLADKKEEPVTIQIQPPPESETPSPPVEQVETQSLLVIPTVVITSPTPTPGSASVAGSVAAGWTDETFAEIDALLRNIPTEQLELSDLPEIGSFIDLEFCMLP